MPKQDKIDEVKDSFYVQLEKVFNKSHKHHMRILLGNFKAKLGRKTFSN
jgi:hypothetical protein